METKMPETNQTIKKIDMLRGKVKKDIVNMLQLYGSLKDDLEGKFRSELRQQKGDYNGLEDFYALVMLLKKDSQTVSGIMNLFKRLNDLSKFNVSEIEDNIELEKIFE